MIQDSHSLVKLALEDIVRFQSNELKPIKFSKSFINKALLGGQFPGYVLGIAGMSGHGKSTLMQELERDIFDKDLNPDCDYYILVRNNYEMSVMKLLLRDLKIGLNVNISDILKNRFTEEQSPKVKEILKLATDKRIKYMQTPTDPNSWFTMMDKFIHDNKSSKHIIITIDHIALVKSGSAGKKDAIDTFVEYVNTLKNKYNYVSFIILSQLNRNIEERTAPMNSCPKKGDLYQSDFLYQLSDVIVVIHNPYKLGLQEHMVIGKDKYTHLNKFKKSPDTKHSSFLTKGNIFYHFIKLREDDDGQIPELHIERNKNTTKSEFRSDYDQKEVTKELPRMEPDLSIFEAYDEVETPFD